MPTAKRRRADDVFRAEAGTEAAAILVVVPVDEVMNAFDGPVLVARHRPYLDI